MKLQFLKLLLLIAFIFLSPFSSTAQDKKLKLHAVSLGAGIASTTSEAAETGLGIGFDFSTTVNKHLISFNVNVGSDIRTAAGKEAFLELNLTYGRKWHIGQYLVLEGHLGIGIFTGSHHWIPFQGKADLLSGKRIRDWFESKHKFQQWSDGLLC